MAWQEQVLSDWYFPKSFWFQHISISEQKSISSETPGTALVLTSVITLHGWKMPFLYSSCHFSILPSASLLFFFSYFMYVLGDDPTAASSRRAGWSLCIPQSHGTVSSSGSLSEEGRQGRRRTWPVHISLKANPKRCELGFKKYCFKTISQFWGQRKNQLWFLRLWGWHWDLSPDLCCFLILHENSHVYMQKV